MYSSSLFGAGDVRVTLTHPEKQSTTFFADGGCLMASSRYFQATLGSDWLEGVTQEITLELDTSVAAFSMFLDIIHCNDRALDMEFVGELLVIQDRLLADCVYIRIDKWLRNQLQQSELVAQLEEEQMLGQAFLQMLVDFRCTQSLLALGPIIATRDQDIWQSSMKNLSGARAKLLQYSVKRACTQMAARKVTLQRKLSIK
jgi:hypothetical protein